MKISYKECADGCYKIVKLEGIYSMENFFTDEIQRIYFGHFPHMYSVLDSNREIMEVHINTTGDYDRIYLNSVYSVDEFKKIIYKFEMCAKRLIDITQSVIEFERKPVCCHEITITNNIKIKGELK